MPVEVFIRTGDRTFFEYLTKPVTDSFASSLPRALDVSFRRLQLARVTQVKIARRSPNCCAVSVRRFSSSSDRGKRRDAMRVEIIEGKQAIERLRPQWDAIYDADPEAQFFLSWSWIDAYSSPWGYDVFVLAVEAGRRQRGLCRPDAAAAAHARAPQHRIRQRAQSGWKLHLGLVRLPVPGRLRGAGTACVGRRDPAIQLETPAPRIFPRLRSVGPSSSCAASLPARS